MGWTVNEKDAMQQLLEDDDSSVEGGIDEEHPFSL